MASQGYHVGVNKIISNNVDKNLFNDKRFMAGTFMPDALKSILPDRRLSHFTGGGYLKYPTYEELKNLNLGNMSYGDSYAEKSYITDPKVSLDSFLEHNKHLSNYDPYKLGILFHLYGDYMYETYVRNKTFDLTNQSQGFTTFNGKILDKDTFRKAIYELYPMLDNYFLQKEGITEEDMSHISKIISDTYGKELLSFILKYIKYSNIKFKDNEFFKVGQLESLTDLIKNESGSLINKLK